ncbi:MAG: cobalamin-dependent protein [Deltaproteobacteria bacterium]|nr:cobalamin-dependent protein [Deltaproteobacteria bacterium]MBW2447778.1 cobalamin-dependent protein [Deltaproteobacteria bacterium]
MSEPATNVTTLHRPPDRVRVVTAASLFDGHDAAINIMRRILQAQGAEVIHLGHDRSVDEIASAVVQEDAHAVAVSSYQGGHMEFFRYLVDRLAELGAPGVRVFGGGGGTITAEEAAELEAYGVTKIFGPEDGRALGLEGMIRTIIESCDRRTIERPNGEFDRLSPADPLAVARLITYLEETGAAGGPPVDELRARLDARRSGARAPVIGFTGTGGAGKSSVVDEIVRRFRLENADRTLAILSVDPSRRRSGGALLGDRIRMNAIHGEGIFVRSLATRQAHLALSAAVRDAVRVLQAAGYDWILIETAGIGQSDSEIIDLADLSVYVMTPEFGAPSQLEKIDMLELADLVVLNKCDRHGAEDALRDVRKQWKRNHTEFDRADEYVPVFGTVARTWTDPGLDRFYAGLVAAVAKRAAGAISEAEPVKTRGATPEVSIPRQRGRYLAEIAETVRGWREDTEARADQARDAGALARTLGMLGDAVPEPAAPYDAAAIAPADETIRALRERHDRALADLGAEDRERLSSWPGQRADYQAERQSYRVRDRAIEVENTTGTLSGTRLPRVAVPRSEDWGEILRYRRLENLPGAFPFTAGVFPFKRSGEDPARMFAGEGTPERTNERFHYVSKGQPAARLSTAFDSVTLYGRDPGPRPDVYGKVGNSGVSICTVDDAKKLYSGFDLVDAATSVSMTINGPAPIVLAFFLSAAIDQQVERHLREAGQLEAVRARFDRLPGYAGDLPEGNDGLGLGLLGIAGREAVDPETYARIRSDVLTRVRGTVQADILKEDQAQNTCIFSTEFALKMMGDIQEYFVANEVRNFYSVSISGYHMAEAGANPITQLAFTLANGFTYAEYYLARGMSVDEFAPNFSFFFSNGLDAEYNVIGRVARRIWAVAMRERYGASERSQKLKYHVQTSGRSLHAQEMAFNDIRTTLQALTALQDHCNSLHTNAYDEAVTTPTEESVRRALAIQLVINRELGLSKNENPLQGSYVMEALTDAVEEAVLQEFERLSDRGGVLGAMETHYQRGKIQEESLHYESLKHSGELPVVGVNTFENPNPEVDHAPRELMRSSDDEKERQLANLATFRSRHESRAPAALHALQEIALAGGNVFEALMDCVEVASLGQISEALFAVGGQYRRAM